MKSRVDSPYPTGPFISLNTLYVQFNTECFNILDNHDIPVITEGKILQTFWSCNGKSGGSGLRGRKLGSCSS